MQSSSGAGTAALLRPLCTDVKRLWSAAPSPQILILKGLIVEMSCTQPRMRGAVFLFSVDSAPQSLDLSHPLPSLFCPSTSRSRLRLQSLLHPQPGGTAGNSPRAPNFNCTESPAAGNDLLWFLLLQQLFLTTKKDNKPPDSISPTVIPTVKRLCRCL